MMLSPDTAFDQFCWSCHVSTSLNLNGAAATFVRRTSFVSVSGASVNHHKWVSCFSQLSTRLCGKASTTGEGVMGQWRICDTSDSRSLTPCRRTSLRPRKGPGDAGYRLITSVRLSQESLDEVVDALRTSPAQDVTGWAADP